MPNNSSWLIWALLAAFFWGLGPVMAKLGLVKPDPLTALLVRSAAVFAVILLWALTRGSLLTYLGKLDAKTYYLLALEGVFASVLAHFAYFKALQLGNLPNVVPVTASYPLVAALLSAILLKNQLTPGKILGIIFIVSGIYLLQRY